MNVLQINNYGFVRGGSDRYFIDVCELLTDHNHNVSYLTSGDARNVIVSKHTVDGIDVVSPSFVDMTKFIYSRDAQRKIRAVIEQSRPDVAHLHIYYGQITPSIFPVLREYGIPVIQTLHEYKLFCPVATMTRNGDPCEECAHGNYWRAILHRCNRGNLARSLATAVESYTSRLMGSIDGIDHYIAVSDFVKRKALQFGIPEHKISTVYNFVRDGFFSDTPNEGRYFLYYGRLELIKGIATLIDAMASIPDIELYIVGTGEAEKELRNKTKQLRLDNIKFLGFKSGRDLTELISNSICVICPSEWNETFGLVILESFAQSRPVIASRMGGMTELVSEGKDGLLFEAGNASQLAESLIWMNSHRRQAVEMGVAGQIKARRFFSSQKHYEDLISIYKKVIDQS